MQVTVEIGADQLQLRRAKPIELQFAKGFGMQATGGIGLFQRQRKALQQSPIEAISPLRLPCNSHLTPRDSRYVRAMTKV